MNGEKSGLFNIVDSIIKQVVYKLLDVGKISSNVAECWATSTFWSKNDPEHCSIHSYWAFEKWPV